MTADTQENNTRLIRIEAAGSRIIPMDAASIGDFDRGVSISRTAERTRLRGVRRLFERYLLRRERLLKVLDLMGFLPPHFSQSLNRYGKFKNNEDYKLAWRKNELDKHEFIFMNSFNEMQQEFFKIHPEMNDMKIPYDWTIYYLRKKSLTQKISKEELAWVLLNFNQKRGYYQLRGEDDESPKGKKVEYFTLKVVSVDDTGDKKGEETWYNVTLENGWVYRRTSKAPLDWIDKIKEFIVTTEINEDGTPKHDKEGNVRRSFRVPKDDDWMLIKEQTQSKIEQSKKTVGEFIYDAILHNPTQKIRGKLVRTIERKFYKDELRLILDKQSEFHAELRDRELYNSCIELLYQSNETYRKSIFQRNFSYLFIDDILFYQRPLKSKKSLISNCPYEEHVGKNRETGENRQYGIKCVAKSHPLYQEFRLWQFINNLRIYKKGITGDADVTIEYLKNDTDYTNLFKWLNDRKTVKQEQLLTHLGIKNIATEYRWNYVEDKEYPCNETRSQILSFLAKVDITSDFLTIELEEKLWHLLYSIDDKTQLLKGLTKFAERHKLDTSFIDCFKKFPPFIKEYGAYSLKAIKKLLPLMRMGEYWSEQAIDRKTRQRIENILTGEYDETIKKRVREKAIVFDSILSFKALPVWLACYIVYDRHSEAKEITKWNTPDDITQYLNSFQQHSLRNPIVEQVITETLRTVKDIWMQYGTIDEIHVEIGREMKNPADKRRKIAQQISENENTNLRIKALLSEFHEHPELGVENVRPHSPSQQEKLRIFENGVFNAVDKLPEDIEHILCKFKETDAQKKPSRNEVTRYKLWLEQNYRSPYTGQLIPLAKLFTMAYEIEHIIPQKRYFDNSLSNKVICEAEVNKMKDHLLGMEFIEKHSGETVELSFGKVVKLFTVAEYEQFVKDHYGSNRAKMRKLLMKDIPDEFIARQLVDTQYIGKLVKGLLSNIVREDDEEEAISKNVIVCTGSITDRLKKDWGINDVWNKIILPRFIRLNKITGRNDFTVIANGHIIPSMPLEYQKGFSKKRIDHRHHAMDAIVIACASRNIVNYLNNESASAKAKISRYDLQYQLCDKVIKANGYSWIIKKPWNTFTQDVYNVLSQIVVSFKQNLRVINKASNVYIRYENGRKIQVTQKGVNWAIRKSMHKDTVFGEVNLRKIKTVSLNIAIQNPTRIVERDLKHKIISLLDDGRDPKKIKKYFEENSDVWQDINLSKIQVYYFTKETNNRYFATRKPLDTSFNKKKIEENVTDTGIQKILLRHLVQHNNNPELAFSPDGIDAMNKTIVELNDGKFHQPIYKVRIYEQADKFAVGKTGNKSAKFVEADKGTNLFFAVYEYETINKTTGKIERKRNFETIPLNIVIDRLKQGLPPAPEDKNGNKPLFVLSPNDLVYVPSSDEIQSQKTIVQFSSDRLYKMVSANKSQCFFVQSNIASIILDKMEFSAANKMERALSGEMIKKICVPVYVNRLGEIFRK